MHDVWKCRIKISYHGFFVQFLYLINYSKRLFSRISHLDSWTCYKLSWPSGVSWSLLRAPWPRKPAFSNYLGMRTNSKQTAVIKRSTQWMIEGSNIGVTISLSSVPLEAINLPLTILLIEQFATRVPVLEKRPVRRRTKQKRTSPPLVALWQAGQVISRCSQISRLVGWPWLPFSSDVIFANLKWSNFRLFS